MYVNNIDERKKCVRSFLKENPSATFKEIKNNLRIKINNLYSGGMDEAFRDAGIASPRNFKIKTIEEKKNILIDYVRKNPKAGGHIIKKETKINFFTVFVSTEELFKAAGVPYVTKNNSLLRGKDAERRNIVIETIRKNPFIGISDLMKSSKVSIYRHFNGIQELYNEAGVPYYGKGIRKRLAKRQKVIEFIKKNVFATQREINRACKTHVQRIFTEGIFGAYKQAEVPFPFERVKLHGVVFKRVKDDARVFEENIATRLSGYGAVTRLVKTKRGFADIILERNSKKIVIELKNYKVHEISISQIKQLNKYLEDINSNLGFLICLRRPKKHTFLMGRNRIFVLDESELFKIPDLIDAGP